MGSQSNTLPVFKRTGFGLDLGGSNWRSLMTARKLTTGVPGDAKSLEELLERIFADQGFLPASAVLCPEGTATTHGHEFTKLKWPAVVTEELRQRFGFKYLEIINDMQGAALGVSSVDLSELNVLKPADFAALGRHFTVLTLSTGLNWTTVRPNETTLPLAREQGHVRLGVPDDDLTIIELIQFVSARMQAPASIEDLLCGGRGVDLMADFLLSDDCSPGMDVLGQMVTNRKAGRDNAPMMPEGALADDPFWVEVAKLYGKVLGYLLNQIVVGELVGMMFIQGSVLNGTPGFAKWLFDNTEIGTVLVSEGMAKSYVAEQVGVIGVPNEVNLAVAGAERRAFALLELE